MFAPPFTHPNEILAAVRTQGFAALSPGGLRDIVGAAPGELEALSASWNDLPADRYLKDGGRYRRRRHSCFIVDGQTATHVPHRAHWQPVDYNALHGGFERWFDPIEGTVTGTPVWSRLLTALCGLCTQITAQHPWYVEAHQFRIDTTDGIGRPTPEGAHRDGVDFVFVILIDRYGVKGGETRVFDIDGPSGIRFTMTDPFTTLMLADARKLHETTPLLPLTEGGGHRDTLVLTVRAGGFQSPS